VNSDLDHTIMGWIKTENGDDVTIQIRYYSGRTTSSSLATHNAVDGLDGDHDWAQYHGETNPPGYAKYFDIRLNSDMPSDGEAFSWFDDVSVVEWTDWYNLDDALEISTPNDYYYLQLKNSSPAIDIPIQFVEKVYDDPGQVIPDFSGTPTILVAPATVQFTENSDGLTGWFMWDFGDGGSSIERNPVHTYNEPGDYDVSLTVLNYAGETVLELKEDYIHILSEYLPGDMNIDNNQDIIDVVMLVNVIIYNTPLEPPLDEIADLNSDGELNVLDILILVNIIVSQ